MITKFCGHSLSQQKDELINEFLPHLFADFEILLANFRCVQSIIHSWPPNYVLLLQTISNKITTNTLIKRNVDGNFLNVLRGVYILGITGSCSTTSHIHFMIALSSWEEYLEESITCFRQELNLCPIGDPYHSIFLSNFATAMKNRHEQLGRMEDLEEAISCHRRALALRPHGHRQSFTFSR